MVAPTQSAWAACSSDIAALPTLMGQPSFTMRVLRGFGGCRGLPLISRHRSHFLIWGTGMHARKCDVAVIPTSEANAQLDASAGRTYPTLLSQGQLAPGEDATLTVQPLPGTYVTCHVAVGILIVLSCSHSSRLAATHSRDAGPWLMLAVRSRAS
jgi:hypothetical protein